MTMTLFHTAARACAGSALVTAMLALAACGGGGGGSSGRMTSGTPSTPQSAAPAITSQAALNNAVTVKLTSSETGAVIYYTVDGSTPTTASQVYQAPFLAAGTTTVKAMALTSGDTVSVVQSSTVSA